MRACSCAQISPGKGSQDVKAIRRYSLEKEFGQIASRSAPLRQHKIIQTSWISIVLATQHGFAFTCGIKAPLYKVIVVTALTRIMRLPCLMGRRYDALDMHVRERARRSRQLARLTSYFRGTRASSRMLCWASPVGRKCASISIIY